MLMTQKKMMLGLLAAAVLSMGSLTTTPSEACGGYQRVEPSERTKATWAVNRYFATHRKIIKGVSVTLTDSNHADAVMRFKDDTKLPPLQVEVRKIKGRWQVAATRTWRAPSA